MAAREAYPQTSDHVLQDFMNFMASSKQMWLQLTPLCPKQNTKNVKLKDIAGLGLRLQPT